jgi:hypothetical protein
MISRFFAWAAAEDAPRHIAWVGISVMTMTAVFFPLTMALILSQGASFPLIMTAVGGLALVVITNLASLPTKYTIPFFLLGILLDIVVVAISFLAH